MIAAFLKARGGNALGSLVIFQSGWAGNLEEEKICCETVSGMFRPQREIKRLQEINLMTRATRITKSEWNGRSKCCGLRSIGRGRVLRWGGGTSPPNASGTKSSLQFSTRGDSLGQFDYRLRRTGLRSARRGHGPLKANRLIVLDIFPRDAKSGY